MEHNLGSAWKGFVHENSLLPRRKSIESQIPAIFKYWRDTISFCIQQLADICRKYFNAYEKVLEVTYTLGMA